MKSPIETFSYWVENGKDDGMEKNHFKPVSKMLNLITENQDFNFSNTKIHVSITSKF